MSKEYKTENISFHAENAGQARCEAEKAQYLLTLIGPEDPANGIVLNAAIADLEAYAAHRGPRKKAEKTIAFEVTLFRK